MRSGMMRSDTNEWAYKRPTDSRHIVIYGFGVIHMQISYNYICMYRIIVFPCTSSFIVAYNNKKLMKYTVFFLHRFKHVPTAMVLSRPVSFLHDT